MSEITNTEAAITFGLQSAAIKQQAQTVDDGIPFLMIPDGMKPVSVESFLPAPRWKRTVVAIRDAASFVEYVKRFAGESTLVFANIGDRTITAVVDYHEAGRGDAKWGAHRAQLTCLLTEDWKRWMAQNKKALSQVEFAQFLEDNLPNIAEPSGATILEMARTLEAKKSVSFSSSVRLDNGQHQITYQEDITGSASKGSLQIPASFTLGIEPFEGAGLYRVEARFRYRIDSGVLRMWFDLIRPEHVVEDAFRRTREDIAKGIEPVVVLAGVAPAIG